jgi:hypothetical protein
MADHAVRLTKTFLLAISSYPQKNIVAVGDGALGVGLADNDFVFFEKLLNACK